ncbi:MAG: aminotransferase class V-fold PLP-dependent enzyme [Ruminococcaceae bacterium]|nr:aminotransferase class V-fold PLP-dependent enzyme [Oscillospiraceae bacterium]
MKTVYLDSAATTLVKPPQVAKAVGRAIKRFASPGRGGYEESVKAADVVFECRQRAADLFCVDEPEKIVFTMNATHGLNIAIKSLCSQGDKVVVSGYEHNAVMRPLHAVGADIVVAESPLFDKQAAVRAFEDKIGEGTKVVVCTHVSNVFGFELPVYEIAKVCQRHRIPLIIDASQSAGTHQINAAQLNASFIAMPGHKGLYGPQGTGILICSDKAKTLIEGGTGSESRKITMPFFLPDRLEAGTHNVAGIAGLNEGLKFVENNTVSAILDHERKLISHIVSSIKDNKAVRLFTSIEPESGVLSMVFEGVDCETAAQMMAEQGIAVRAGLHCAPLAHKTAGTIEHGTVRVSVSAMTSVKEVNGFISFVNKL